MSERERVSFCVKERESFCVKERESVCELCNVVCVHFAHIHTQRVSRTHKHSDYTKKQTPGRLGMDKDARNRNHGRSLQL